MHQSKFMTLAQDEPLKIQIKVNSSNLLLKILIICILILLSVKMLRWNWEISSLTRPSSCQLRKCIKETNRRLFPETTSKNYMKHNHFNRFHTSILVFIHQVKYLALHFTNSTRKVYRLKQKIKIKQKYWYKLNLINFYPQNTLVIWYLPCIANKCMFQIKKSIFVL